MKTIYGAPSTGVPLSESESRLIQGGAPFTVEMMQRELESLTEVERQMKHCAGNSIDYDYSAFRNEEAIFAKGNFVHVLRHLRYDRHELHSHAFFEIVCQISGEGTLFFESDEIALRKGNICLLAPGVVHRLSAEADDSVILKIIMRRSDFDEIFGNMLKSNSLLSQFLSNSLYSEGAGWLMFEADDDPDILETLLKLRYYEVRAALTDDIMKQALVMQLFCYLTDRCINRAYAAFSDDIAGKILVYIGENFRTVTLSELENVFHFSGGYISRIVKRASGSPFTELVSRLRIDRACELLESTDMNIQEIIYECGFGCREFFYKTFKRLRGITPTKYRKEHVRN